MEINKVALKNKMSTKQKSHFVMDKWKTLKIWKKGALMGGVVGIIGTVVTYITGDISVISIPVVLLFSIFGAGLLFLSHLFELIAVVTFYVMIGAIIGYLIGGGK